MANTIRLGKQVALWLIFALSIAATPSLVADSPSVSKGAPVSHKPVATQTVTKPVLVETPPPVSQVQEDDLSDTYPASLLGARDTVVDRFGMSNRECVSYTAWKVQETFGNMPNWTAYTVETAPNASRWIALATRDGIPTGNIPKAHSVAIATAGQYIGDGTYASSVGHSMWVEAVYDDGSVLVSEYNRYETGTYSITHLYGTNLTYIYFGR